MLQDGSILSGRCHDDSSDDEPERKDGKDIGPEEASYTNSFSCYYNKVNESNLVCNYHEQRFTLPEDQVVALDGWYDEKEYSVCLLRPGSDVISSLKNCKDR